MGRKGQWIFLLTLPQTALALLWWVEQVLRPGYWGKSIIKVICFTGIILLWCILQGANPRETVFLHPLRRGRSLPFWCAAMVLGVAGLFLLLRPLLDTDAILTSLTAREHLTRENCLFVFTYVSVVNSFLEEVFFRGFLTHRAAGLMGQTGAAVYSAVLFALYHIAIVSGWFSPLLLALAVAGLGAVGLALQWICERWQSAAASWMVHAAANVVINAIGAILIFTS
ncbi:MAG: CPBP family intramembrane metalloprotease [Ruminococcaceae bacterium]|nr:CPBP family intramembrane metalloprotease [Oscillospiraceae bacterium]